MDGLMIACGVLYFGTACLSLELSGGTHTRTPGPQNWLGRRLVGASPDASMERCRTGFGLDRDIHGARIRGAQMGTV